MAIQTPGVPSTSKPGYVLSPVRVASLSSAANYYNHGTFPGLVNWLFVLTEPELTGELGDGDSKGMRPGGIIRWLGRPSSQLKPAFHAREDGAASAESLAGSPSSQEQVTVFKRATDLHVPRSWGPGADLGHRPDRGQQVRQDLPHRDFRAPAHLEEFKDARRRHQQSSPLGPRNEASACSTCPQPSLGCRL